MGRMDPNATTQYHQGLQSQETIDDVPPHEDDLYEPPPVYHKPRKLVTNNINPQPNRAQAQAFPPQDEDYESISQAFPPVVHNNEDNEDDEDNLNKTQQFPPRQPVTAVPNVGMQFGPSAGQSGNFVHHHHHHQPPPAAVVGGIPSPMFFQNQLPVAGPQPWKTHLFDCMKDPQNAIITACFPCVTFGQIAEIVDSGGTTCATSGMLYSLIACCIAMPCLMSCGYRSKMRAKFGLVESPAPDCLVHCFCEWCALCQEYRELQERGLDPSIGWMGNQAKQRQQMQQFGMTPPMQQRMM